MTACSIKECRTVAVAGGTIPLCVDHREAVLADLALHLARRTLSATKLSARDPDERDLAAGEQPTIQGFVYFIRRERLIKIGYSTSPEHRARDLGGIVLATIPGDFKAEKQIHRQFAHLRQNGEWFSPGEDLIGYINCLRSRDQAPDIAA